jgi:hypothetical protein
MIISLAEKHMPVVQSVEKLQRFEIMLYMQHKRLEVKLLQSNVYCYDLLIFNHARMCFLRFITMKT